MVFVFTELQNIFNILIFLVTVFFFAMKLVSTALKKGDKKSEVNASVRQMLEVIEKLGSGLCEITVCAEYGVKK